MNAEPGAMMTEHHQMALWVHAVVMALGAWLIASPVTLGYRSTALAWSDVITGFVVIALAALSFSRLGAWAAWANAFVGIWLLFAPLVFWAPDASAYMNDTLVGALVIGFAILIPHGMPMSGPDVPPGWSYNPSTPLQRAPIVTLAVIGFLISRYLAAYQLHHIEYAWDPVFGAGTEEILESEVSRAWPISDAGLGALSYMLEGLMGFMGDRRRWRTMPWMVAFFGILVIPLGVTSIVLVILQPVAVGTWCTACLVAAAVMLVMIPATLDEVVAMLQFMGQSRREGKSLWRTFWLGGTSARATESSGPTPFDWAHPLAMLRTWFTSVWPLLVTATLGLWLMAAPAIWETRVAAADNDHLIGALVVTFAIIATADVGRALRFVNLVLGGWLVLAPWLLAGAAAGARWNDVVVGIAVILLSLPRGMVRGRYGTWNAYIR
jgi:hypothetical protein